MKQRCRNPGRKLSRSTNRFPAVAVAAATGVLLASCSSGPTTQSDTDQYLDDLIEVSNPVNVMCDYLAVQGDVDPNLPELLTCEQRTNSDGQETIVTIWDDPVANANQENPQGTEWVWATAVTTGSYFGNNLNDFPDIDLVISITEDECGRVVEMGRAIAETLAEQPDNAEAVLLFAVIFDMYC